LEGWLFINGDKRHSSCNYTFSTPEIAITATYTWTVAIGDTFVSGQS